MNTRRPKRPSAGARDPRPPAGKADPGPTILVVEDNPITVTMVAVTLRAEGYSVVTAADGKSAIEALRRNRPTLVLQDMQLPDMDGADLIQRLRALPGGAEIPILAFSGDITRLEEARAANAGFSDFVPKPFEPSVMVEIIRGHLGGATRRRSAQRRVLLVDDDPVQLKTVRLHLLGAGFEVATASGGAEALRLARAEPPKVIVCDVFMPEMDGFQFCLALRNDPALHQIPVVLSSAHYIEEEDQRLAREAGASAYVCRSGSAEDIIAALNAPLTATAPARAAPANPQIESQRQQRIVHQLERQLHMQTLNARRNRMQNSILQHLGAISEIFSKQTDTDVALNQMLATCLNAAGLSKGLLYTLGKDGKLALRAQTGSAAAVENARQLFGFPEFFRGILETQAPVACPSAAVPQDTARALLSRLESNSLLLMPLSSHGQKLGLVLLASATRELSEPDWLGFGRSFALQLGQAVLLANTFSTMAESEQRFRSVFENAQDAIYTVDNHAVIQDANPALARMTGYSLAELRDMPIAQLAPAYFRPKVPLLFHGLQQAGTLSGEFPFLRKDGAEGVVRANASRISPQRFVAVVRDITQDKRQEEIIRRLAYTDQLTDLPNLTALSEHLAGAMERSKGRGEILALLILDIAGFREINDTLGHQNGDLLLMQVAQRLRDTVAGQGYVARLAGDNFAIVLPRLSGKAGAAEFADRLGASLRTGFAVADVPLELRPRIGGAYFPEHTDQPESLLRFAEVALYQARYTHRRWMEYDPRREHHDSDGLALIGVLHKAIERNELVLHYQPKLDLATMRLAGVEALVRWQHPVRGLLYPDRFIPAAESTGLIHSLTQWVLSEALRQAAQWQQRGWRIQVSANISVYDLLEAGFAGHVRKALERRRLPPDRLILEITESAIMYDPEQARAVLHQLHKLGVQLSLDDFGVGQASLTHLKDLPLHGMKIDKSFVIAFKDPRNAAIVRSAVDLATNLGLGITAEGVEDEATLQALKAMGCTMAQGYHIGKPLPVERFETWLRESPWARGGLALAGGTAARA